MALTVGDRLGHYDVTALIGEGGMGQVWQATDTQFNCEVALKILPDAFAADPDRLARFQREAQVLASLNHPGIAAIYGIEEAEGTRALVLELVEGPTLADRIAEGPIPLDEALPIAKQIAEGWRRRTRPGSLRASAPWRCCPTQNFAQLPRRCPRTAGGWPTPLSRRPKVLPQAFTEDPARTTRERCHASDPRRT